MTTQDQPAAAPTAHSGPFYWLLSTALLLLAAFCAAQWASSIPVVFTGAPTHCDYHSAQLASDLVTGGMLAAAAAGFSALCGVIAARGLRVAFALILILSPIAFLVAAFATFYTPPGCPGPFS